MLQFICVFVFVGFNSTETKIKTSDGKVWNEEDFHNFTKEIYRDMSHNFPGKYALGHQFSLHFVFSGLYIVSYLHYLITHHNITHLIFVFSCHKTVLIWNQIVVGPVWVFLCFRVLTKNIY